MSQIVAEVYPTDAVIRVKRGSSSVVQRRGVRGRVTCFSAKSRRRLLFAAFNACCEWLAFITLTYPAEYPAEGSKVKRDLDTLRKRMKRKFGGDYLWGMEFQERNAPHLHLLSSVFIPKDWLAQAWFEIVGSGDKAHLRAGTRVEGVHSRAQGGAYMAKAYTAKHGQKEVPVGFENVGRFWGITRGALRVLRVENLGDDKEAIELVRACRKFTERQMRTRRVRPMRKEVLRKRGVRRKPRLINLHAGLFGFTVFRGRGLVERLLQKEEPKVESETGEILSYVRGQRDLRVGVVETTESGTEVNFQETVSLEN